MRIWITELQRFQNYNNFEKNLCKQSNRAAFSDGFEGKSWYVLKINKETKVSFNKMLLIIDKYY